ncbi:Lipase 1 [Cladobotryum mycophilum]|uniref:Carboxylic ester hydrolase n=1 Tax=Cladobotryum mycophilum TaxID=491253 RepID=A0ABR0SQ08_9HYPO
MLRSLPLTCLVATAQALIINLPYNEASLAPVVDLGYAKYRGVGLKAGVDQFLGMRYAEAPLGDLRFRAPQDPTPQDAIQDAIQDATNFGPICVGVGQTVDAGHSEDCLFVNVFKPSTATNDSNLPVWVYIQGGGYSANANQDYNGTEVVKQSGNNIVFVNFNYRVGALGFLASPQVQQDGALNAGLLDQRKLLHWVQTNIKKFGGDPNHVVIHGASAGAGSVAYHLTAYNGKKDNKLFAGAIAESPFWPTQRTVNEMEFQYVQLQLNSGCEDLACLRSLDVAQLLNASNIYPFPNAAADAPKPLWYWLPVIDGDMITDHFYNLFNKNQFIHVPFLVGDDTDEGRSFGYNATTPDQVTSFLKSNYPNLSKKQLKNIKKAYKFKKKPVPQHADYFAAASAAYGDATFTCPGMFMAWSFGRYFNQNQVFSYRYNVQDEQNIAAGLGVPHVFESSAIFGPGNAGGAAASYYTTNAAIVPITMRYFISFVRAFDPNTFKDSAAPIWIPFGSSERMKLQTNNTEMEILPPDVGKKCSLWMRLSYAMGTL